MIIKSKAILFCLILLLFSCHLLPAQMKEFRLKSGYSLILEPVNSDFVTIQILVHYPIRLNNHTDILFSEMLIQSMKNSLKNLAGKTTILPMHFRPENPCNWLEQRMLIHQIKSKDFNHESEKIISILNKKMEISNRFAALFQYEVENILTDSLLFVNNDFKRIKEIINRLSAYKGFDLLTLTAEGPKEYEISIYMYGEFNPLNLIPYLKTEQTDQTIFPLKNRPGDFESTRQLRFDSNGDLINISIPLQPATKYSFLITRFLLDCLLDFFHKRGQYNSIRFFYPWSLNHYRLHIMIDRNSTDLFESEDFFNYFRKLQNCNADYFLDWYKTQFISEIHRINENQNELLLYKHFAYFYAEAFENFFYIRDSKSIDFNEIQTELNSILLYD